MSLGFMLHGDFNKWPCHLVDFKAYIRLRRKIARVGSSCWLRPLTRNFTLGIPTCWYLKTLKFASPPTQTLKFALPPTRNSNVSPWNTGCVGSPAGGAHVGHVHYMLFASISFALVSSGIWA